MMEVEEGYGNVGERKPVIMEGVHGYGLHDYDLNDLQQVLHGSENAHGSENVHHPETLSIQAVKIRRDETYVVMMSTHSKHSK